MHNYCYTIHAVSFCGMMLKICIFLLKHITTVAVENDLLRTIRVFVVASAYKINFGFVQISKSATERFLRNFCAIANENPKLQLQSHSD